MTTIAQPGHFFERFNISIPAGAHGEIRAICPECSPLRRKKNVRCLAVNADKGTWLCHHCGWSGALGAGEYRRQSNPLPEVTHRPSTDQAKAVSKLRKISTATVPLEHPDAEPARNYLKARGLVGILDDLPADIQFHRALAYWENTDGKPFKVGEFPALVALVRDPNGVAVALHRTYLKPDGSGKADVPNAKKLTASILDGGLKHAAIRLYPAGERLAVAEGIETALAVRAATGMPTWATVSAGGMARLEVPDTVREVFIAADNDASGAGKKAAYDLARRLAGRNVTARVVMPDTVGSDWADILQGGRTNGQ